MTPFSIDLGAAARQAMLDHGFEPDFGLELRSELDTLLAVEPSNELPSGVADLRHLLWSSIDNRDSRDLDQVEVAERRPDDVIRLRVAVADVDALVPPGSAIDARAGHNTLTVYAAGAVFPMLPPALSTGLTSLNEGADRRALVVELDVAADGAVLAERAVEAMVRNHARLEYDGVGAWLSGAAPPPLHVARTPGLDAQLRLQTEAARRLLERRRADGALSIQSVEVEPVVVNGRVIDLRAGDRNRARDLIEELMVAANGAIARILVRAGSISIRRVVRRPARWARIVDLAGDVGETLPATPDGAALGRFLLRRREADPEHFPDLSLSVVKLLGAGEYILERRLADGRREGHFGLGIADYVHSTSPNRRFADLVIQRLLKAVVRGRGLPIPEPELMGIARTCTERGDAARKIARAARKRAAAVFVAERVGEEFVATVTGASHKGTWVRVLRPPVEGRLVEGAGGVDVGDTMRVRLLRVDPAQGHIDFVNAAGDAAALARKLARARRKKAAAERLRRRVGDTFAAEITKASPDGTYARLLDAEGDGRVVSGDEGLAVGQRVPLRLVRADTVHGFIDFEYEAGVAAHKRERAARKREAARALAGRVGEEFDAVVSGVTRKAVFVRVPSVGTEGRLVRGTRGRRPAERLRVVLLATDAERGWVDFAAADLVVPLGAG